MAMSGLPLVLILLAVGRPPEAGAEQRETDATGQSASRPEDPNPAPGSAYYQFLLARHLESEGDVDGAIAAYRRAAELDPKASDIPAELAGLFMRLNRTRDAIEAGEAALALDASQRDAHRVLGLAYAARAQNAGDAGRPDLLKAVTHLEQALGSSGLGEPGVERTLARLYLRTGSVAKAVPLLTRMVTDDPEDSDAVYLLVQAYGGLGRPSDAVSLLEQLAAQDPQYYRVLGELYERDQQWQKAASAYAKAVEQSPRSTDLRLRWATALLNSPGETSAAEAREILQKVVADVPTETKALYLLSQAQRREKDLAGAEATARKILSIEPKGLWGPLALSQVFEDRREYKRVVDVLEPYTAQWVTSKGGGERPEVARLLAHLGFAYQETKQPEQAVAALEAATRLSSDAAIAFQLGAVLERQKKYSDAERAFLKALDRNPEHAPTLNYLGYMLADRGERLDQSVDYIRRALKVEPDNPSYLDSLGWAYFKLDRLDQAEPPLRRASEQLPDNRTVQDHWGDLLFKLGRFRDAIAAWEQALSGDGDDVPRVVIEGKIRTAREKSK